MMDGPLIFGGGEIAERGIIPAVGGAVVDQTACDVRGRLEVDYRVKLHGPTVVINCAGVSRPAPLGDSESWYEDEIDVNLFGSFAVADACVRFGVDTMIFMASVAGLHGKAGHAGYAASKAGVISLVQSLAAEGHNAYAISPGRVDTAMRERDFPDEDPKTRLQPEAIGSIIADILAGRYTSGDNIVIRMKGHDVIGPYVQPVTPVHLQPAPT